LIFISFFCVAHLHSEKQNEAINNETKRN